jgi:hypothetical protein
MRLKSSIWVSAYIRRVEVAGSFAVLRRKGAEEAGVIFIKIDRLDGTGALYGPAPQSLVDEDRPTGRLFCALAGGTAPAPDADIEARLQRECRFDPDIWIVEVEDRQGRHFLDDAVVL